MNTIALDSRFATDDIILSLLQNGNEQGLRLLYRNYNDAIYGIIMRIVRSEETAEEVLNDVFLKCFHNIASYDPTKSKLFTWIARIARNASIDKVRTVSYRNSLRTDSLQSNESIHDTKSENVTQDPESIQRILKTLDADARQMIEMVYLQGYTHEECAQDLDVPLGTVKTKVRRGLIKLREYLSGDRQILAALTVIILIYVFLNLIM